MELPSVEEEGEQLVDVGQRTDNCSGEEDRWLVRWRVELVVVDDMVTGEITVSLLVVTDTWWWD